MSVRAAVDILLALMLIAIVVWQVVIPAVYWLWPR